MEDLFSNIVDNLRCYGFDFNLESKLSSYNPLEYFVEQVSAKEIRHSQILEDLLDENGPHGYKDLFRDSFLKIINCKVPNNSKIEVERERKISRIITKGGDRSIDLVLSWVHRKKPYAIIIENKLNGAKFQPCQLSEYKLSLENEGFVVYKVVVIYDKKISYGNGVVSLCSSDISNWLNSTLQSCDTKNSAYWGIKAYAQLVDNLAIKNINMVNAESIIEMARSNPESFEQLTKIVNAYNELNSAVFNELVNAKQLEGIESEIKSSEVQFWNPEDYERNKLYVVVQFNNNKYNLYIKNDNIEKDRSRTLSSINFVKWGGDSKEWYIPKKESDSIFSFPEDTDRLIRKIKKLIEQLKSING
ncbi:MAG: PD-(D/E)XK nuclease family protein [Bacteroidales bacterium]|nr:PD-(D/E)XK nuclease family protein [Bacteroidales bacterium]